MFKCVLFYSIYCRWTGNRSGLLADILWFNAHIGIGLYIYQQPFMRRATTKCRVIYTAFSTALFNFGSALIWGTVRTLMPVQYSKLKILFGTGSGLLFLHIGWNFIQFLNFLAVDNQNKV